MFTTINNKHLVAASLDWGECSFSFLVGDTLTLMSEEVCMYKLLIIPLLCSTSLMDSSVWALTPSSAATTSTTMSVTLAPLALMALNTEWPGVSRKVICFPDFRHTACMKAVRTCTYIACHVEQLPRVHY